MTGTSTGTDLTHAIGADGLVSLRLRDGEIRLRAVDGDTLRVRDTDGRDLGGMFSVELGDGSASLLDRHGSNDFGNSRRGHAPELEVELPRRATLILETVSADIDGEGLLGDQRYQTTSGDIALRAVSGRITVEAVSADIDARAVGEADIDIRTVSGDVELRAATLRSLHLATTSGDVKVAGRLTAPGPFSVETVSGDVQLAPAGDVRIEMTTMSGDLHSDLDGRSESGRGRQSFTVGSAGPQLTFRSMSGDLNVVRPVPVLGGSEIPAAPPPPPAPPAAPPAPPVPPTPVAADPAQPLRNGAIATSEPVAAAPAQPLQNGAIAAAYEDARLRILRSLERGEIDVAEAGRRFEALDGGEPLDATPSIDPATDTTRSPVVDRGDA